MKTKRLLWADSLKGLLILFVILGHSIQSTIGVECYENHLWNFIYSFHMPAFMAISGWLSYRNNSKSMRKNLNWIGFIYSGKRRFLQLLVPYLVWTVISYILKCNYTLQAFGDFFLYPDRSFWFLWVLFWICVIFNLTQLLASRLKLKEMILIFGTCLLLFVVMIVMEVRVLGFQFLAYYFLFYTLGYCLHKYEDSAVLKRLNKPYATIAFTLLWAFLAWGWTMHGLPSWLPSIPLVPSSLIQYAYRSITAMVVIVVLIGIAPTKLNGTDILNQLVCSFGIVSLGLYVVHLSIMDYIVHFLHAMLPSISTWLCVSVAFFTALTLSYIIVRLLSKNEFAAMIFLGKIK